MADEGKLLKGGLALIAAWFLYKKVLATSRAKMHHEFSDLRVKINGFHQEPDAVIMSISVQNPNTTNFDIQSIVGSMYAGGTIIADAKMFGDYNIKGNSELSIPIIIKPYVNVFKQSWEAMRKGKSKVRFSGTMNVNREPVAVTLTYSV